jgi:hypothetical protein
MTPRRLSKPGLVACAVLALGGCETLRRKTPEPAPPPPPPPVAALPAPPAPPPPARPAPAPVARACVPRSLAPPPRYPDTDAALRAAPGAADRYQLMAAGRILRGRRLDELERVVAGCR